MIEKINKDWKFEEPQHCSSDQNGVCWIDPAMQQHVGINLHAKKQWASDILKGTASLKEPPNITGIDLVHDGCSVIHPQGCAGRHTMASMALLQPQPTNNLTTVLAASKIPLLPTCMDYQKHPCHDCSASPATSLVTLSPAKPATTIDEDAKDLLSCIQKFQICKGHDLRGAFEVLKTVGLTVELIPDVAVAHMLAVMSAEVESGVVEGVVMAFQKYCREVVAKREWAKRSSCCY
ncbi:hypothetical protein BT96DRAFT_991113 [Gymnopus androsaceus JB14]|uniref:Uncharacterized protein n=1 Tax=Gymnopus androsaceus JB14 TaxID=1447944 RepID=A0A6A4HTE6_9AGAR|nr:hypothetical protein BT96DRAFT_991113 [Gymnopus androsaceus JB14]